MKKDLIGINEWIKSLAKPFVAIENKKDIATQIVGAEFLDNKNIGQQPLSVVLPHLQVVAKSYNLKLNRASDFKLARTILTSWTSKHN